MGAVTNVFALKILPAIMSLTLILNPVKDTVRNSVEWVQVYQADKAYADAEELSQEIIALLDKEITFEYKGVTYTLDEGYAYANSMFGTEDYYPIYDAIRDASVARSTEMGELLLERVRVQNRYACLKGYDNYWDYVTKEKFHYDESMPKIMELIAEKMPRLLLFLIPTGPWDPKNISADFLDENDYLKFAAESYGKIDRSFQTELEELINSGRIKLNAALEPGVLGQCEVFPNQKPNVNFAKQNDASFAGISVHEFGHYIHEVNQNSYNDFDRFGILETHSIGGVLLQLDELRDEFIALTGDETDASFLTLSIIWSQLGLIVNGVLEYQLMSEIYAHPENYTAESIAQRWLEIKEGFNFNSGWSPEYRILSGTEWIKSENMLVDPAYNLSYALAGINAIWLLYQQETNGTGREIYTNLIKSSITDVSYVEYCTAMGLPDFTVPASYERLDDFIMGKVNKLLDDVYSE